MRWLVDVIYFVFIVFTTPIWLVRMIRTGKIHTDWAARFGRVPASACRGENTGRPRVLIHAVSVGEVNAIRSLVPMLDARGLEVVVAATTDTGIARASALFGERHRVVRFPFDLSWVVGRFMRGIQPDLAVLVELEVWPNFMAACTRRGTDVLVINGRLTSRSHARYRLISPLLKGTFARLAWVGAQEESYAARFRDLGVGSDRVDDVGNMKWDNARCEEGVEGSAALRDEMGIDPHRPLIVAGSTSPGEHELIRDAIPPGCQVLCAPRKPEWFDQAATVFEGCTRRSDGKRGSHEDRYLLDSIGELSQAYDLADLAIVGRSFVQLHGSDVTEPIGLGVATIVGPAVVDFQLMVDALREGEGLAQVPGEELASTVARLIGDPETRHAMARRGRSIILEHQGATSRYADKIVEMIQSTG